MKRLFCVTKLLGSGQAVMAMGEDDKPLFFEEKTVAKAHRNFLNNKDKKPEDAEAPKHWHVSKGPDHNHFNVQE